MKKQSKNQTKKQELQSVKPVGSIENSNHVSDVILPPILPTACKENEIWEVKNLVFDIVPFSKPSSVINRLNEKRKLRHEQTLADMYQELEEENTMTENLIRHESDVYSITTKNISNEIENVIENVVEKEMSLLDVRELGDAWKSVKRLTVNHRFTIDSFYKKLLDIEKNRIGKGKVILRRYHQLLKNISFKLPHDLQDIFEYEIMKMNKATLNNLRCYADLHLHLSLLRIKKLEKYKQRIISRRQSWKTYKKKEAIKVIRKQSSMLQDPKQMVKYIESAEVMKRVDTSVGVINKLITRWQEQVIIADKAAINISEEISAAVQCIDNLARDMLNIYKDALLNVYTGIYKSVDALCTDFKKTGVYNRSEIEELEKKTFRPVMERIEKTKDIHISDVDKASNDVIMGIHDNLKMLFTFLHDSSDLWQLNNCRSDQSRRVILDILNKVITSNVQNGEQREVKFNILLDRLRQANNEKELEETLENIKGILNEIELNYNKNYERECAAIESYISVMEKQIEVLMLDIQRFLARHPQTKTSAYFSVEEENDKRNYIPRELQFCELQVSTLQHWKYGLWEAINISATTVEEDLKQQAKTWVNYHISEAKKRLELKKSMHHTRYNRVLLEVFQVRLTELRLHRERLNMHIAAEKESLLNFEKALQGLVSDQTAALKDLESYLTKLQESEKEVSSSEIKTLIAKVEEHSENHHNDVQITMGEFQEECKDKTIWLRQSTINFLKCIKLFSEGGNFSANEAQIFSQELKDLNTTIDSFEKAFQKRIREQNSSLMKQGRTQCDARIAQLKLEAEDMVFSEDVMYLIKKTQTEIKREVFSLKYKGKLLHQKAEEVISTVSENHSCDTDPQLLFENWNSLFTSIHTRRNYLLQSSIGLSEMTEGQQFTVQQLDMDFNHKDLTEKNMGQTDDSNHCCELLFGFKQPSEQENTFISHIRHILCNEFGKLQDTAVEYYKTKDSKNIIMTDLIQTSYDMFIEDLLVKFKYYYIQCEEVWLKHAQDFFNLILKLQKPANKYAKLCIDGFYGRKMNYINETVERVLSELKKKLQENSEKYQVLDEKLKPLHGYPGNKTLLENLNNEVTDTQTTLKADINTFISNNKIELQELIRSCELETTKLKDTVESFLRQVFDPDITRTLEEQMETVKKPSTHASVSETESTVTRPQNIARKEENVKIQPKASNKHISTEDVNKGVVSQDGKEVPKQYQLSLDSQKFSTQTKYRYALIEIEKIEEEPDATLEAVSLEDRVQFMLQEYTNVFNNFITSAEAEYTSYIQAAEDWLKIWNINVEKVKKLYTGKYACL